MWISRNFLRFSGGLSEDGEIVRQDLIFAARLFQKRPWLTILAVMTLGLGMGAVTTQFIVVKGLFLQRLPFPDSEAIHSIHFRNSQQDDQLMPVSRELFPLLRERQSSFEDLHGFYNLNFIATFESGPRYVNAAVVTPGFLQALRVQPQLGRGLMKEDEAGEPVTLISHRIWHSEFGGDPDIIGKTLRAHKLTRTIVGVLPSGFHFPYDEDIWAPYEFQAHKGKTIRYGVFGRLLKDHSREQAEAEITGMAPGFAEAFPKFYGDITSASVTPFLETSGWFRAERLFWIMLGATFLVLLIACTNTAGIHLALLSQRSGELAVRCAFGATRRRIVSQVLTESLLLSIMSAVVGVVLSQAFMKIIRQYMDLLRPPFWHNFDLDAAVIGVVALVCVGTVAMIGLIPAWRSARSNLAGSLQEVDRSGSQMRVGRLFKTMGIMQLALSFALLVGAGLLVRTVLTLTNVEIPFDADSVIVARTALVDYQTVAERAKATSDLIHHLNAFPAIDSTTVIAGGLPVFGSFERPFQIEGEPYASDEDLPQSHIDFVAPRFFETLGKAVLLGRDFAERDRPDTLPVAIVNESFVREFYPDGQPLGKRIRREPLLWAARESANPPYRTIVGVVPNMLGGRVFNRPEVNEDSRAAIYIPYTQYSLSLTIWIIVRPHPGNSAMVTRSLRRYVSEYDPNMALRTVSSIREVIKEGLLWNRIVASLFLAFGSIGLLLATTGVYGFTSYSVSSQTREFGIRAAMGASPDSLRSLVFFRGSRQLGFGLLLGIVLAVALTRLISSQIRGISEFDPSTYAAVGVLLLVSVSAASYFPARRAMRVDPSTALREV